MSTVSHETDYDGTVPDSLRDLTPNARTLWWYLIATGAEQDVRRISQCSGIPLSSVYHAAARYPDHFTLTGSLIRRTQFSDLIASMDRVQRPS